MPSREIEYHPYLDLGFIKNSKSLILGTFPVYWCTDRDSSYKQEKRKQNGSFRFFYGSNRSQLWKLYAKYIDTTLEEPFDRKNILRSLVKNNIAISDLILSCERKNESASDNDLKKIAWNVDLLQKYLIEENITRILCTSKYVLSKLSERIMQNKQFGNVCKEASQEFMINFISKIGGDINYATGMIAQVYEINGRIIEGLAIPSPGSPCRQLGTFGFSNGENLDYANSYFKESFSWLIRT